MASGPPIDPLQTLATALVLPSDSKEQADILVGLREHLEIQPAAIPVLCVTLLGNVLNTDDTPFKRWILDLFNYAISRSTLTIEVKTDCA
jgi:symplekin